MLELYVLLILMIVGSVIALEIKDLLSCVVSVGAVGLCLSVTFLLLKAPDLAITQLVVEILMVIILIRATLKKDLLPLNGKKEYATALIVMLFTAFFLLISYYGIKELPVFGNPLLKVGQFYLDNAVKDTGAVNVVASVILDYRGFDTLGEATVLFTAVIGVFVVVRNIGRKRGN